jgi:A/G-specific adenine glycosylase
VRDPGVAHRAALHEALLAWFDTHRRDLPWRRTRDPYAIWLSEVMLQQTRVETVIPYYARFLEAYPTVSALAEAPLDDVLRLWSGLGYYRRARMLHAAAKQVHDEYEGALPKSAAGLRKLHGVGAYTAGAVASIASDARAPLVDGNVVRVLARLFAIEEDLRGGAPLARLWELAGELVPERRAGDWNQALMELGATVCVPKEPRCLLCPASALCAARARGIERSLPLLKPKAKPTAVRAVALVAQRKGALWLVRRALEGVFGGMWEPPLVAAEGVDLPESLPLAAGAPGLPTAALVESEPCGRVRHVLSHRRFEIDVHRGVFRATHRKLDPPSGYVDAAFAGEGELDRFALTTLARKVLRKAGVPA